MQPFDSRSNRTNILKSASSIITLFAIAAFAAGCKPSAAAPTTSAWERLEKVKTETTEGVQDVNDYTFAQKAGFAASMKSDLAKTSRELNELEGKAESSSDAVKADDKLKLEALGDQATGSTDSATSRSGSQRNPLGTPSRTSARRLTPH